VWWSATTGGHVGFESWMERDGAGFRPNSSRHRLETFWLSWRDEAAKLISHAPDFFARRADGTSVVVEMQAGRGLPVSTGRRRWPFGSVAPVLGP
jgi:hypothetical protein